MAIRDAKVEKIKTCVHCNRNLVRDTNFISINGKNAAFPDGYYPVCKRCIEELVNEPVEGYKNFINVLMGVNRPYKEEEFNKVGRQRYKYLVRKNPTRNKELFIESDRFFNAYEAKLTEDTIEKLTPEELRDCQLYWGEEYVEDEYLFLISRYEDYCNAYDVDTPTFQNIITQICQLELDIRKKRIKSVNTKDETKMIMDLMRTAGIAPSQEKASKTNENETFGVMVKRWENEKPVPEALPEFKDIDNIEKYMRNNFLSPMLTSLEADNPYEEEYQEHVEKYGISEDELLGSNKE
ncbi:hypothetical protein K7N28_001435 [Staphylococcus pseudintermedius]|nr:hypothetical protein [Staphylococcus pseudintermedius]